MSSQQGHKHPQVEAEIILVDVIFFDSCTLALLTMQLSGALGPATPSVLPSKLVGELRAQLHPWVHQTKHSASHRQPVVFRPEALSVQMLSSQGSPHSGPRTRW